MARKPVAVSHREVFRAIVLALMVMATFFGFLYLLDKMTQVLR